MSDWKTHLGVTESESGTGIVPGGGYEIVINQSWDMTVFTSYSTGSTGDEDYDAITFALGFNYKIRRQ